MTRSPFFSFAPSLTKGMAHFSPDGRWVACTSDESGRIEVYVRFFSLDAPGGIASNVGNGRLMSRGGGVAPSWRADGKELYSSDKRIYNVRRISSPTSKALVYQAASCLATSALAHVCPGALPVDKSLEEYPGPWKRFNT